MKQSRHTVSGDSVRPVSAPELVSESPVFPAVCCPSPDGVLTVDAVRADVDRALTQFSVMPRVFATINATLLGVFCLILVICILTWIFAHAPWQVMLIVIGSEALMLLFFYWLGRRIRKHLEAKLKDPRRELPFFLATVTVYKKWQELPNGGSDAAVSGSWSILTDIGTLRTANTGHSASAPDSGSFYFVYLRGEAVPLLAYSAELCRPEET